MNKIAVFEKSFLRKRIPEFRPGDTVRVHLRVVEGERERIQVFQGTVLKRQGSGMRETFTVRKVSFGVGVERTFLLHSPMLSKIEVKAHGHVRRSKLYYLRERVGKKARVREKMREGALPEAEEIIGMEEEKAEAEAAAEAKAEAANVQTTEVDVAADLQVGESKEEPKVAEEKTEEKTEQKVEEKIEEKAEAPKEESKEEIAEEVKEEAKKEEKAEEK